MSWRKTFTRSLRLMIETERVVLGAHEQGHYVATVMRYPYVYGPYSVIPAEWHVIQRVLDGRRRWAMPGGGLAISTRCAAPKVRPPSRDRATTISRTSPANTVRHATHTEPSGAEPSRRTWQNGGHDGQGGGDVPRKGRARRFREARKLKQGYDDGLFREGSGTLADVTDDDDVHLAMVFGGRWPMSEDATSTRPRAA